MRVCFAVFGTLAACVAPATAGLVTINADIGGTVLDGTVQTGQVPVDPAGTAWNELGADVTSADLKDSTGAPTGIGVALVDAGGNALPGFTFGNGTGGLSGGPDVLDDYFVATNGFSDLLGPVGLEFTGLSTTTAYNFYFITVGDTPGQGATITLDGTSAVATGSSPSGPLSEGDNFVSFLGVTPSSGTLSWSIDVAPDGDSRFAALSGFQIQVVPEPAAMWFLMPLAACWQIATPRRGAMGA